MSAQLGRRLALLSSDSRTKLLAHLDLGEVLIHALITSNPIQTYRKGNWQNIWAFLPVTEQSDSPRLETATYASDAFVFVEYAT